MRYKKVAFAITSVVLGFAPSGCKNDADWFKDTSIANARLAPNAPTSTANPTSASNPTSALDLNRIPVPAADGPKLVALAMRVPVRRAPTIGADVVGTLRLGARVARSTEAISTEGCVGGWYAVRPIGFVCNGDDASTNLEHPIARAIQTQPNRSWPMPYRYGFVRAIAPNYLRVPTKEEQHQYEMRLERHLRNWKRLGAEWDVLDVGANDIPLDARGLAVGKIPEHARPLGLSERYGGDGSDAVPWWLAEGRRIPNLSAFRAPTYAVIANRLKRHAGIAMIGSFVAGEKAQNRRFVITTDARLVPADKVKADSGSPFHGQDIAELGLPVAFAFAERTYDYELTASGAFEKRDLVERRSLVPLNGTVRESGKQRFVQTRAGGWLNSGEIRTIAKPSTLPAFAVKSNRWIDISLLQQALVLYEGSRPVYATLVSSGRDGLGDPAKTLSTPQGVFRVYQKHITTTMDSDVADNEFELRDVPWVMYFQSGYAIHAAYWHDDFGRSRSHGCVNLSPIDARYVFNWSSPDVPEHWHSANSNAVFEAGTLINIHP
jgi:lipoprotein-anchoring transpeptidase ErfK/SrfK